MEVSAESLWTAGVAVICASVITVAPSVQPSGPEVTKQVDIRLTALVQQSELQHSSSSFDWFSLTDWVERVVIPPSLTEQFPPPPSVQPPVINPQNLDSTVKSIYYAVEPWVHYGFQLAQYAVGWIPYVGWLAPQIDIFYRLGERIVRSGIFNFTEWLTGQGTALQNLGQFVVDTINSFIYFANDQIAFWLPPLPPPLPPIFGPGVVSAPPNDTDPFAIPQLISFAQATQTVEAGLTALIDFLRHLAGTPLAMSTNAASGGMHPVDNVIAASNPTSAIAAAATQLGPAQSQTVTTISQQDARNPIAAAPRGFAKGSAQDQSRVSGAIKDSTSDPGHVGPGAKGGAIGRVIADTPKELVDSVSDRANQVIGGVNKVNDNTGSTAKSHRREAAAKGAVH